MRQHADWLYEQYILSDMPKYVSEFKKCEKCAKLRSVRCAECLQRSKCDDGVVGKLRNQFQQFQDRTKQPSTLSFKSQVKGGTSGENKKESAFSKVGSNCQKNVAELLSSSTSTSRLKKHFISNLSNNDFMGKVGRGKNEHTPTKRKLLLEKQVTKLVTVFDSKIKLPVGLPGDGKSESPAKKRKLDHQGSTNFLANNVGN